MAESERTKLRKQNKKEYWMQKGFKINHAYYCSRDVQNVLNWSNKNIDLSKKVAYVCQEDNHRFVQTSQEPCKGTFFHGVIPWCCCTLGSHHNKDELNCTNPHYMICQQSKQWPWCNNMCNLHWPLDSRVLTLQQHDTINSWNSSSHTTTVVSTGHFRMERNRVAKKSSLVSLKTVLVECLQTHRGLIQAVYSGSLLTARRNLQEPQKCDNSAIRTSEPCCGSDPWSMCCSIPVFTQWLTSSISVRPSCLPALTRTGGAWGMALIFYLQHCSCVLFI